MRCSAALNKWLKETQVSRSELIQGDSRYKAMYKCLKAEYVRCKKIFELGRQRLEVELAVLADMRQHLK
eukprot:11425174-Heterocapsa_arctica.AAC.1